MKTIHTLNKIYPGDALKIIKTWPDNFIQCCVTSPPYFGLRDYGINKQYGLEPTLEEYINTLVTLFKEVKRVLKDNGTLFLNIGDCYNGSGGSGGDYNVGGLKEGQPKYPGKKIPHLKPKDLIGVPWRLAFALQADGWYLRQDIIWNKPNPMPESVTDRCTKAHEYIFLLTKSKTYYYNAKSIQEKTVTCDNNKRNRDTTRLNNTPGRSRMTGLVNNNYEFRNKRSVWEMPTQPYSEAHFATFPESLPTTCIKAGTTGANKNKKSIVLDPFMGAGTTAVAAIKLNCDWIGTELNQSYITDIAEPRIAKINGDIINTPPKDIKNLPENNNLFPNIIV